MENNKDQELINFQEQFLLEGEKIVWFKSQKYDLIIVVNAALVSSIVFTIVMILIIGLLIKNIPLSIAFIGIILPVIAGLYFYAFVVYLKRKHRLNLTYRQLKMYKKLDVVTDKRFIKRDYELVYKERDMNDHFKNDAVKQEKDFLFTDLNHIDSIGVNYYWNAVFFFVNHLDYSYLRIYFDSKREIDSFLQAINEAFTLEIVEGRDPLIYKYKMLK